MKAFVMKKIGEVGIVEKGKPEAGPMDAIIRFTHGLVCTSDVHTVHGAIGERKNATLGHEAVGIVEEVGDLVKDFEKGDRVAVCAVTPDWGDRSEQRGFPSHTPKMLGGYKFTNIKDGTFAEFFHVNQADANMAKIPDDVSGESAVYATDMMSTGFIGAENANIPMGGSVAIFGQGPIGLMATKGSNLLGAGLVIAVETVENRKELAKEYGADYIVDFKKVDPIKEIMDITDDEGTDSAIECLGIQETFENCIKVTKAGGTISNLGYHGRGDYVKIPRMEWGLGMSDKTIKAGVCPGGRVRMERMLQLLKTGRVDPTKMTTHEFTFDEIERAFELMETKEKGIIKPLIKFE